MPAKKLSTALFVLVTTGAHAAPVTTLPPPPGSPRMTAPAAVVPESTPATGRFDLARLEQIQSETLLLEAQAAKAKAERAAQGGDDTGTPAPAMAVATGSTLPRIAEISGAGRLAATLMMPDNSQVRVSAGQRIAGTGLTVSQVTAQQVIVKRQDGTTLSLPMED